MRELFLNLLHIMHYNSNVYSKKQSNDAAYYSSFARDDVLAVLVEI